MGIDVGPVGLVLYIKNEFSIAHMHTYIYGGKNNL
jgi:hypothetical protein